MRKDLDAHELFWQVATGDRRPGLPYTILRELPADLLITDPTAGSGTTLVLAWERLRRLIADKLSDAVQRTPDV